MATNGTQVSWVAIGASVTIVGLLWAAQWNESQTQFANVEKTEDANRSQITRSIELLRERVIALENEQAAIREKLAHDPVENRTFAAVTDATDKRLDLIEAQITDVNRQIAAALIIIDDNAGLKKTVPLPP